MELSFLCYDGVHVWGCSTNGDVILIDPHTSLIVRHWWLPGSIQDPEGTKPLLGVHVQCMRYVAVLSQVFIALSSGVLLSYTAGQGNLEDSIASHASNTSDSGPRPTVIRSTFLIEAFSSLAPDGNGAGVQLWCGHAGGHITVLSAPKLDVLACLTHPESAESPWPMHTVLYAAQSSPADTSKSRDVWTASYPSQALHCWDARSHELLGVLNCGGEPGVFVLLLPQAL